MCVCECACMCPVSCTNVENTHFSHSRCNHVTMGNQFMLNDRNDKSAHILDGESIQCVCVCVCVCVSVLQTVCGCHFSHTSCHHLETCHLHTYVHTHQLVDMLCIYHLYLCHAGCRHEVLGTVSGRAPAPMRTSSPAERELAVEDCHCAHVHMDGQVCMCLCVEDNWHWITRTYMPTSPHTPHIPLRSPLHTPHISSHRHLPIDELSVGQFSVIRKLCLLRLTAVLEMYNPNNKIGPSL